MTGIPNISPAKPRSANGAELPPPAAPQVERAVIAELLLHPKRLAEVAAIMRTSDLSEPQLRVILSTMLELSYQGKTPDPVLVAQCVLERTGQDICRYLASLTDEVPAVANVLEHARHVVEVAASRRVIELGHRLVAEGKNAPGELGAWLKAIPERVGAAIGEADPPSKLPAVWVSDLDLISEPPKHTWLFHDTRAGRPVPLLRRGKVFVLAADGGVGKSFIALQMAACLSLGRPLFDAFQPEVNCGRIALLMGEDDAEECQDRLYRICNALGLSAEERLQVQEQILLFPLTGHEVSFLSVDQAHNPRRTEFLEAIVQRLNKEAEQGGFEWAFVAVDPLARFASGDAETDNGLATAFVQAVESIAIRVTGEPAVMVTHHSSKVSGRAGTADVRGVTGLRNGFRAAFTLGKVRTGELQGVLMENSKNNLAPEAPQLWLVRMGDEPLPNGGWLRTSGVLRAATPEEGEALRAASGLREHASPEVKAEAKQARVQVGFRADCDLVESLLPEQPRTFSRSELGVALEKRGHKWGPNRILNAMGELVDSGRAVDLSDGRQRSARQWAKAEVHS